MEYQFAHEAGTVLGDLERTAHDNASYCDHRNPVNESDQLYWEEQHNAWIICRDATASCHLLVSLSDQIWERLRRAKKNKGYAPPCSDALILFQAKVAVYEYFYGRITCQRSLR